MSTSLRGPAQASPERHADLTGRLGRTAGAVVLAAHGAIHLLGVPLLWRLGEPGSLRYAEAHPVPGSVAGLMAGGGWLLAAVLFPTTAVLLVRRRSWQGMASVAALLSIAVLAPSASVAAGGLVVDAAVLGYVLAAGLLRGRSRWTRG